ncbi:pilus assembly PilX family protein [Acinetobacter sp. AS167]|uniref:pilus assembly PilX family protein n=1 Tax=Acinetobacter sp. AS167 TaxID=3127884 RepID=UPI003015C78D
MKHRTNLSKQKGSTIIVVMMMLLFLTIVGVMAIRTSMTTLNIATNAQISQLSSQTADTPINQVFLEDLNKQVNLSSVIGKALKDADTEPGKEYVFCYKPRVSTRFGSVTSMAVLRNVSSDVELVEGSTDNFCNLTTDFGSARRGVVTQVSIKIPTDTSDLPPLALLARNINVSGGQTIPQGVTEQKRIRMTTVAVMPIYAKNLSAAQACLKENVNDNSDAETSALQTTAQCLVNLGIPVNSQVQEFNLQTFIKMVKAPV